MRQLVGALLFFVLVVVVALPALIARGCGLAAPQPPGSESAPPSAPPSPSAAVEPTVTLYLNASRSLKKLPLEEYVRGVVAAEMPVSFSLEALKAQAVLARTYVLQRLRAIGGPGCDRHPQADICDDPSHGQAWASWAEMRRRWGFWGFFPGYARVRSAVAATRGLVVAYGGRPIDPLYHSTCGGATEDAAFVWGTPQPWLRSVPCSWDRHSPYTQTTVSFSPAELARLLAPASGQPAAAASSSASAAPTLKILERSPTRRVMKVQAGAVTVTGGELRARLGLKSTLFDMAVGPDGKVTFTVTGWGHGVGLCQYGADGMGREGKTFADIIRYYYSGAEPVALATLAWGAAVAGPPSGR